jgi:hypothetical protein
VLRVSAEVFETGEALPLFTAGWSPETGLGVVEGPTVGSNPAALPAPMNELDSLFRSGCGPSGTEGTTAPPPGDEDEDEGEDDDGDGEVDEAEVTATVSEAAGGVHLVAAVVGTAAVAVSFTELTEVAALAATAICACRSTGCLSETEPIVHEAFPLPLAQPLVNVGFWLAGWVVSVTVTPEAGPFCVEIVTAYLAACPRLTLDWEVWTVTHSETGTVELLLSLVLGLGLGLPTM